MKHKPYLWMGNFCFDLNGGLDGLHKNNWLNRLMYFFYSRSYGIEDEAIGKRLKEATNDR